MRYVVTGAAGFIGSQLAEALLADGEEVVCVDCFTDYYPVELKQENAAALDVLPLDLAEADLLELVEGADGVFHLAAQPGVRLSWGAGFEGYVRDNVLATQRLFEAAASAGVRVVFSSSSSVYGQAPSFPTREDAPTRPISPYGVTKLTCEQLAHAYRESAGLDVVSLRYFTVYGPRQRPDMGLARMVAASCAGSAFEVYGDGRQSRDFTYVQDAVSANRLAMEHGSPGCVYNIGGGSEATLLHVAELLAEIAGERLRLVFRASAVGDARRTAADTTRARRELGWRPSVALEDGLAAQWRWHLEHVGALAGGGV